MNENLHHNFKYTIFTSLCFKIPVHDICCRQNSNFTGCRENAVENKLLIINFNCKVKTSHLRIIFRDIRKKNITKYVS